MNRKVELKDFFNELESDEDDTVHNIGNNDENNDIDPLDEFMKIIHDEVKVQSITKFKNDLPEIISSKYEDEDIFMEYKDREMNHEVADDEDEFDQDIDINSESLSRKPPDKVLIEKLLPIIDHSQIEYSSFKKCFYFPSSELKSKSSDEIIERRQGLQIAVTLDDAAMNVNEIFCPVNSFEQCGFDDSILNEIDRLGYKTPTPIQAQGLPIIMSGYDVIGLAKTGSGKTMTFILPILVHIRAQPKVVRGEGPIAIVIAPTRELVVQIYQEMKKFSKFNVSACPVYGGPGKWEMAKALQEGPNVVIASPGRLIELTRTKATNFYRCTVLIFDECDRCFDLGFENQIKSIIGNIRPDRQVILFSATLKNNIEQFVKTSIKSSKVVRIVIGKQGQANADIKQEIIVLNYFRDKFHWLKQHLDEFISLGKVLIFVNQKETTEYVSKSIEDYFQHQRQLLVKVGFIHGDVDQNERMQIIKKFSRKSEENSKNMEVSILVATDVASRGLDIYDIQTVINYDIPKNIDTYVHRIGRTGRLSVNGQRPGTAYTLLVQHYDDGERNTQHSSFAVSLVQNLQLSGITIPQELTAFAMTDAKSFKLRKESHGGGRDNVNHMNKQGLGIGNRTSFTSEMLANNTKLPSNSNINGGTSSTMSFGKLLGTSSNQYDGKSKYMYDEPSQENLERLPLVSTAPTLPGFVRSSQNLSSVQGIIDHNLSRNVNHSTSTQPRKKSRWDT